MHFSQKLARRARRLLLGVAILATALLLAVLVVDWCGARAWKHELSAQVAEGLALTEMPPPGDLAPERNLMCAPIVQRLLFKEREAESFSKSNGYMALLPDDVFRWTLGHRMNMEFTYQAARKRDSSLPEAPDPAQALLEAFKADRALVSQIRRAALERGDAQVVRPSPLAASDYLQTPLLVFRADRRVAGLLRVEACVALRQGKDQEAFENTLALLRLARGHGGSGQVFLVESMMQSSLTQEALWPIWEASRLRRWDADQWSLVERELERLYLPDTCVRALQLEAYNATQLMDRTGFNEPGLFSEEPWPWLRLTYSLFFVQGFRDQNKVTCLAGCSGWVRALKAVGTPRYPELRAKAEQAQKALNEGWRLNPNKLIFRAATADYHKVADSLVTWQSYIALARVAGALEVHRLREGHYPASLEGLGAERFGSLPRDPVDGSPLHYRLREDGDYELYAVGVDAHDDGGVEQASIWPKPYKPGDVLWCRLKEEARK